MASSSKPLHSMEKRERHLSQIGRDDVLMTGRGEKSTRWGGRKWVHPGQGESLQEEGDDSSSGKVAIKREEARLRVGGSRKKESLIHHPSEWVEGKGKGGKITDLLGLDRREHITLYEDSRYWKDRRLRKKRSSPSDRDSPCMRHQREEH